MARTLLGHVHCKTKVSKFCSKVYIQKNVETKNTAGACQLTITIIEIMREFERNDHTYDLMS